ncbi:MAG TPA: hypothetical protein VG710_18270 [Opitutus sp.]|nr:hypothetical protein [Opitutus sp.]
MPLVISKSAGRVFAVRNEEWLGEILGHSDFDGAKWAVGDAIVFEEGSIAEIQKLPGQRFYTWSEPRPVTVLEVANQIMSISRKAPRLDGVISDWTQLFAAARSVADLRYA